MQDIRAQRSGRVKCDVHAANAEATYRKLSENYVNFAHANVPCIYDYTSSDKKNDGIGNFHTPTKSFMVEICVFALMYDV